MYATPFHDQEDRAIKCERLCKYLDRMGLDELWFATGANFGWLLGGNNLTVRSRPEGVAVARFAGDSIDVFTNNIEAQRLRDEELPDEIDVTVDDWYEWSPESVIEGTAGPAAAADIPVPGVASVDPLAFRSPLTDEDVHRLREVGRETASALEAACRDIESTDTEHEVAADLGERLSRRGIDSPVRLVGGMDRAPKYRHFMPTDQPVGGYAVVSVSAQRNGVFVSASRTVAHDPPSWLEERHEAATRVEATAIAATQQVLGQGTAGDVFSAIQDAYEAVGHPQEWKRHHQGGATGYAAREWIARPGSKTPIRSPIAVAWNPTVQGAKSEDSVLVTDDEIEVLTQTGEWPVSAVESIDGDVAVDRPAIVGT